MLQVSLYLNFCLRSLLELNKRKLDEKVMQATPLVNSNPQYGSDIISRQSDSLGDGSTSICISLFLLWFTSYEYCPLITEDCKSSLFFFGVLLKVFKMAFSKLQEEVYPKSLLQTNYHFGFKAQYPAYQRQQESGATRECS